MTKRNILVNFRIKPKEKTLIKLLALKMDLKVSELIRELLYKKLREENLIN